MAEPMSKSSLRHGTSYAMDRTCADGEKVLEGGVGWERNEASGSQKLSRALHWSLDRQILFAARSDNPQRLHSSSVRIFSLYTWLELAPEHARQVI